MVELGSDCVGRAVASDSRDPRFESRHQQTFIEHLFIVKCVERTKIKNKEAEMATLLRQIQYDTKEDEMI